MTLEELLPAGRSALERGDWQAARSAFEQVVAGQPTAEAFEALGTACWWQDDHQAVLDAREQAYRMYQEQGDARSAARLATLIGVDYSDYRGDWAVAGGWLQRAESLLAGIDTVPEHGWLQIYQGYVALMFANDAVEARRRLQCLTEMAPRLNSIDIEMMSVALRGLTDIREGKIADGMRALDEAMTAAVGGDMSDLAAIGNTCCSLIYACEAVADYDRAEQWCERTREFCRRLGLDVIFAICRNYYASVLIWKGAWEEADSELSAALRELQSNRPSYALESLAKLGELRRRQGRTEEATEIFARAQPHRTALFGQAALALDRGDAARATDLLQRVLRRVGEEDQAERAFVLDLLARAELAEGKDQEAEQHVQEIEEIARVIDTRPLHAVTAAARGMLHQRRGEYELAKQRQEDAIDLLEAGGAHFESARVRLEYADTLSALDRRADAIEQAVLAQSVFNRLGAALYAQRASTLAASLSGDLGSPPNGRELPHGLTAREAEVLWLIAAGKTNQEIAEQLVLSIRTVERHISTVYEKLDVHGRAARASAAAMAANLRPNT